MQRAQSGGKLVSITVDHKESGRRLDKYMQMKLPGAGLSFLCKMIRKKNITVNDKKADPSLRLKEGDRISVFFSDETYAGFLNPGASSEKGSDLRLYEQAYDHLGDIDIVYEDEDFIFIDKPSGALSQQARPGDMSVNEWLVGRCMARGEIEAEDLSAFKPAFANRLDRNTSGIMLGGKSLMALQVLNRLIREGRVEKYYLCLAEGRPDERLPVDRDSYYDVILYMQKDEKANKAGINEGMPTDAENTGTRIHTSFRLVRQMKDSMLLEARLHTGKSHQIRASLAHLKHPIIGDTKYGSRRPSFGDHDKKAPEEDKRGQLLHAYRVVFSEIYDFPAISNREFRTKEPGWGKEYDQ